jgi:transcriptional regulator with XRE-family HTH domain
MESVILQERFKQRVREAMAIEGITQSELARRMGVTRAMISQYLNKVQSPGLEVVEKFAIALKVDDPALLLGRQELCIEHA